MEINRREFMVMPAASTLAGALLAAPPADPRFRGSEDPPGRPVEHDRARSGRAERRGMGRLLGQPEGGRGAGERHRHPGLLSDQGAVPPQGQVPGRPRFLRRVLRRGQETRPARDRAHESGPELGGRRPGASGMVPARRAGRRRCATAKTRGCSAPACSPPT